MTTQPHRPTTRREHIRALLVDTFHHGADCNDAERWSTPRRWDADAMAAVIEESVERTDHPEMSARDRMDVNRDIAIRARRDRKEALDSLNDATLLIERVDRLHQPDDAVGACEGCGATWPCKTARILDRGRA